MFFPYLVKVWKCAFHLVADFCCNLPGHRQPPGFAKPFSAVSAFNVGVPSKADPLLEVDWLGSHLCNLPVQPTKKMF